MDLHWDFLCTESLSAVPAEMVGLNLMNRTYGIDVTGIRFPVRLPYNLFGAAHCLCPTLSPISATSTKGLGCSPMMPNLVIRLLATLLTLTIAHTLVFANPNVGLSHAAHVGLRRHSLSSLEKKLDKRFDNARLTWFPDGTDACGGYDQPDDFVRALIHIESMLGDSHLV